MKRLGKLIVFCFAFFAVSVQAATIIQTRDFDLQGDTEVLSFEKFDPSLGTLFGVVYTGLTSMYAFSAYLHAVLASPGTCSASAELVLRYTINRGVEDIFSQPHYVLLECIGDIYGCDDQAIAFAEPFTGSYFDGIDDFVGTGTIDITPAISVEVVSTSTMNAYITDIGAATTWSGTVTLQYTYIPGCSWDIEPAPNGDGDVDGYDLVEFAGREYEEADLAAFAAQFGRADCF